MQAVCRSDLEGKQWPEATMRARAGDEPIILRFEIVSHLYNELVLSVLSSIVGQYSTQYRVNEAALRGGHIKRLFMGFCAVHK